MRISQRKFEALVERALGTIPAEIRRRMDNVEIVVDAWPDEAHYATVGLEPGLVALKLLWGNVSWAAIGQKDQPLIACHDHPATAGAFGLFATWIDFSASIDIGACIEVLPEHPDMPE